MSFPRIRQNRGVMLVMALALLGVLWFMVLGFARSSIQSLRLANVNLASERALHAAEAGLVVTLKNLKADPKYRPPKTSVKLMNSASTYQVFYLEGSAAPVKLPTDAIYLLSKGIDRSGLYREVGVVIKLGGTSQSLLNFAVFSSSLSLNGGSSIDSYDSKVGPNVIGDKASVGTNSTKPGSIEMAAGTSIRGEIQVGPGGVVGDARPSRPTTKTENTVWKNWNAWSGAESTMAQVQEYPPVEALAAGKVDLDVKWNGKDVEPGAYGELKANGGGEVRLTGGTYVFESIKLNGGAKLTIVGDQPVTIYVKDELDMSNGTVYNSSETPRNLIFMLEKGAEAKLTGGAKAFMVVYGPEAEISMSGGTHLYGAVVADEISMTGGARIHYDEDLARTPPGVLGGGSSSKGLSVLSWQHL